MSVIVRPALARGHANHGWLDSYHTFSFASYHDQQHMGFGALRVINEDRVAPGQGFGTHGHRDMEIISYVISGALEHKDSIGTGSVLRPGDVQVMSAGAGIRHSEFNASAEQPVHFLQIWLLPDRQGHTPRYDQKMFAAAEKAAQLRLVVSGDGRDGSLMIHQDASIYSTVLAGAAAVRLELAPGRRAWVQMVRGAGAVNGVSVAAGDGVAVSAEAAVALVAGGDGAEALVFDLA